MLPPILMKTSLTNSLSLDSFTLGSRPQDLLDGLHESGERASDDSHRVTLPRVGPWDFSKLQHESLLV